MLNLSLLHSVHTVTEQETVTELEWGLQDCKDGDDVEDESPLRRRVLHFEEESLRRRGLDIDKADITNLEKRLRWRRNFKRPPKQKYDSFKRKLLQKVDLRVPSQSCISAAGSSISRVFSLLQLFIRSGTQCRHSDCVANMKFARAHCGPAAQRELQGSDSQPERSSQDIMDRTCQLHLP